MKNYIVVIFLVLAGDLCAQQGPFHHGAGEAGSHAIHRDSNIIVGWAIECNIRRGYENIANGVNIATSGNEANATGKADGFVVSLGDSGVATYSFQPPLSDHEGYDFAIFENGFSTPEGDFLELATISISSNGLDFFTFPTRSLTSTQTQISAFGVMDPSNIDGLAGKYIGGYGTPFDFEVLDSVPELDISSVSHIRVTDVVGSINASYATYDQNGNAINDPYPTEFASSGFDLDALAVINKNIVGVEETKLVGSKVYPNPVQDFLKIENRVPTAVRIIHMGSNEVVYSNGRARNYTISVNDWPSGFYIAELKSSTGLEIRKIVIH